jgi:hypothetical protein
MFASVSQLAFDRDDNLYVLDQGNARILVFDPRGQFVRQFGKQGGGPGEFQFPASLNIMRDGNIVVFDMMRRGYSVFDPQGNYVDHVSLPEGVGNPRTGELLAHPRGGVIGRAMPAMSMTGPAPTDSVSSPVFHQMLGEEGTVRTLYDFRMPAPQVQTRDAGGGRQARIVSWSRPTFGFEPSWGVLPDGRLAISQSADYEVLITDENGRPQSRLSRPFRAREVTRNDQEAARRQQRKRLEDGGSGDGVRVVTGGGGAGSFVTAGRGNVSFGGGPAGGAMSKEQIDRIVSEMQFATEIPAIQRVTVDAVGTLWIRRNAATVGADDPIDLVTADGRYIGTLNGHEVPRAISASGLAAYIEKNDLDIEQVVVRRLPDTWR